jgi:membrane associated rhomboid family serine protease
LQVTDRATGQFVQTGVIRRLATAAAGSLGVSVTYVLRLGKTPLEFLVENYTATLSSATLMAPILAKVSQLLVSVTGLPASAFSVSAPSSELLLVNAPFSMAQPSAAVAAAVTVNSAGTVGGTVGGIVCAAALACAVWARRSYQKHKKLPCCRDRKTEVRRLTEMRIKAAEAAEIDRDQ